MTEENFTHFVEVSLKANKINCLGTILSFPEIQKIYFQKELFYPDFVHTIYRCITVQKEELVTQYGEERFQKAFDTLNQILALLETIKRYFSDCSDEDLIINIPIAVTKLEALDFSSYSDLVDLLGYNGRSKLVNRMKKIVKCASHFMRDPAFQQKAIFSHYCYFSEMLRRLDAICQTPSDIIYFMYAKDVIKLNSYAPQTPSKRQKILQGAE